MKFRSVLILLIALAPGYLHCQEILLEKVIQPAGKELGIFGLFGVKSIIPGTGSSSSDFPPAIAFTEVKNDGFVIRRGYEFTKYDENGEKQWSNEIKKIYGLQSLPSSLCLGSKTEGVYFIMQNNNPSFSEITITRFDKDGKMLQVVYPVKKQHDGVIHYFLNEKGLNFLTYRFDRKERKMGYSLISFAPSNLAATAKSLPIEFDSYEIENYRIENSDLRYYFLSADQDKIILQKSYFKDVAKNKKKELIVKTVEIDVQGKVSNPISYPFLAKDDSKFLAPQLVFDKQENSLRIFGYMTINSSNQFIDGVYVYKYEYSTGKNIFSNQIELKQLGQLIDSRDTKNKIHKGFGQIYPVGYFDQQTYQYDNINKNLQLYIFDKAKGFFKNKMTLFATNINSIGEISKIEELVFDHNPLAFPDYISTPISISLLYENAAVEKKTAMGFINSFAQKPGNNLLLWSFFERKEKAYDILISVNESNSKITAYRLK